MPQTRTILICTAALLLLSGPSAAQESKPNSSSLSVRLVAVKGSGALKKGAKPVLPAALKPYHELLKKLSYEAFAANKPALGTLRTGKAGALMPFEKLPCSYSAELRWEPKKKGKYQLNIVVRRDAKAPKKGKEKVLALKVEVKPGAGFVVECKKAYPKADLLLLFKVSPTAG